MPRKIKSLSPTTKNNDSEIKSEDNLIEKEDQSKTPPAESAQDSETPETVTEETTDTSTRRPRKKLRRPVISDTISAIPVAAFQRLVREITADCKSDMRWEADALQALQADTEAFLIGKFQKAKETLDLFGKNGKTVGENMLRA